jgi:hypothetical protein
MQMIRTHFLPAPVHDHGVTRVSVVDEKTHVCEHESRKPPRDRADDVVVGGDVVAEYSADAASGARARGGQQQEFRGVTGIWTLSPGQILYQLFFHLAYMSL